MQGRPQPRRCAKIQHVSPQTTWSLDPTVLIGVLVLAVLSDRLSGLVDDGILDRRPDPDHAGRHLYELTAAGRDLWPAVSELLAWGSRHRATHTRVFKHAACGTALEGSYCPKCEFNPPPDAVVAEPGASRRQPREDPVAVALRRPHRLLEPLQT